MGCSKWPFGVDGLAHCTVQKLLCKNVEIKNADFGQNYCPIWMEIEGLPQKLVRGVKRPAQGGQKSPKWPWRLEIFVVLIKKLWHFNKINL